MARANRDWSTTEVRIWTPEDMYVRPDRFRGVDPPQLYWGRFTPEFVAFVRTETNWVREDNTFTPFPKESQKPVGLGEEKCPRCKDTGTRWVTCIGTVTGLRMQIPDRFPCPCRFWRRFWATWRKVPERFADVDLRTMQPVERINITIERQAEILELMRSRPDDSYFLYGPVGTGKTHFLTALYRQALLESLNHQWHNFPVGVACTNVWRISTLRMLQENTDWNSRDRKDP